ncbi:hypothetical protein B0H14DRAFT_3518799 [Mycena olivaceomarginata]|nr:hypothetical protein B0H14DRAFT_3518799 [Mycena olivaceomarginata]
MPPPLVLMILVTQTVFESSNTSGGYGLTTLAPAWAAGINTDSSFGRHTDDLAWGAEFNIGRGGFTSGNRDEFNSSNNCTEFDGHRNATMGDKVKEVGRIDLNTFVASLGPEPSYLLMGDHLV